MNSCRFSVAGRVSAGRQYQTYLIPPADVVRASARRTTHVARRTTHDARRTTHDARRTTHDARRTTHDARRTTHDARRTTHDARRTTHDARPGRCHDFWNSHNRCPTTSGRRKIGRPDGLMNSRL